MKNEESFSHFDVETFCQEKQSWSTGEIVAALEPVYGLTKRKLNYRVNNGAFQPVPEKVGGYNIWKKKNIRGLVILLERELAGKASRDVGDDGFFQDQSDW